MARTTTSPKNTSPKMTSARSKAAPTGVVTRLARQERSVERINQLLAAAARVYDRVGLEAATMTDVAASANTSIGTLYHWFPDKETLTHALSERLLDEFMASLAPVLTDRIEEHTYEIVAKAMAQIAVFTAKHPVFAVLLDADPESGSQLHAALTNASRALIESRVPGIDAGERDLTADTVVALCRQMLAAFDRWPKKDRALITEEYRYLLMAYLLAKYPAADSTAWTDAPAELRPSRTARSPRLLA